MKIDFKKLLNAFISERFIFTAIIISSLVIYFQTDGKTWKWLTVADVITTVIFILEMVIKHYFYGPKEYWSNAWNRMDGILVILSLPSLATYFVPIGGTDLSVLLALRLLRALRFFRFVHFFGDGIKQLGVGFKNAMKASRSVLAAFSIIIVVFGLINCSLFREVSPEYFGSPLRSIYSVYQLFTIEGWYEIPASICPPEDSTTIAILVRLYFCVLLIIGGIVGMSFINSVFVDAMMADDHEELHKRLDTLEAKLDQLLTQEKTNNQE